MAQLTPMMQQYMEIKQEYSDCILFYRLGDFYEMFYEDALTCSKELEITLTGKNCGQEERAPMCGVPFHAVDGYLNKMVEKGYKVALCEQVEDPKASKGIVKREVIRIVTPGTNLNTQMLDETKNNYLMAVFHTDCQYGISVVDVTTGDFYVTEVESDRGLYDEINRFEPSEIICNNAFLMAGVVTEEMKARMHLSMSALDSTLCEEEAAEAAVKKQFKVAALSGLGLADYTLGVIAAGMVLSYLHETQKNDLENIITITPYTTNKFMVIDSSTRRNLELTETLREKQKRGSLLWVLDKTKTAMGARLLRNFVEQPLIDCTAVNERLDALEEINHSVITREELREYLNPIHDIERLIGRVSYHSVNPRDLTAFRSSLAMLPPIKYLMEAFQSPLLRRYFTELDTLEDIYDLINRAIPEEPPISVREGGIIKDGYNEEADRLRKAKTEGKSWIIELEAKEREASGIRNLRIKYNRVFGYYLEVTNSYKDMVPDTWTRKQTLANAERYITPELKELEDMILGAEDRLCTLEYSLFCEVRDMIAAQMVRIQATAKAIAGIDVFASLALVAERNNYTRPHMNEAGIIDIRDGRHPVVEKMIPDHSFVENDTYLDNDKKRISIITGPNMAGKSTYMRQTALIVLMAQIGSFVPAKEAEIGIVDRIFTRVGASDDLASGQSTFMVEMTEVANILRNATKNSLLILDEIGRGTSTYDGLSIAWAVVEYISNPSSLGAKALFATHYHELTELEGKLESVNNYCIAVKEQGEDIVFLRKIIPGGADKSYGIQVAKLAGIPAAVLERAREIASKLDQNDMVKRARTIEIKPLYKQAENVISFLEENGGDLYPFSGKNTKHALKAGQTAKDQMSLFGPALNEDVIVELRDMDLAAVTPIDALNKLFAMQKKIKERV